jgi:hypothetical protein
MYKKLLSFIMILNTYALSAGTIDNISRKPLKDSFLFQDESYQISIYPYAQFQAVKIKSTGFNVGGFKGKRDVRNGLNILCESKGLGITPEVTVCNSKIKNMLPNHTQCFSLCTPEEHIEAWRVYSHCGDDCDNATILERSDIKKSILLDENASSPIISLKVSNEQYLNFVDENEYILNPVNRIKRSSKTLEQFISNFSDKAQEICDMYADANNLESMKAQVNCGENYEVYYGSCNSGYNYQYQCVSYCK